MGKVSTDFLDRLQRWLLSGIDLNCMAMSPDQRYRAMAVYEAYHVWLSNKQMTPSEVFRRIAARDYPVILEKAKDGNETAQNLVRALRMKPGVPRTPTEISNDIATLNWIIGKFDVDISHIERAKVMDASDWLIREGKKMGDARAVKSGADLKMQVNNNFRQDENPLEQMPSGEINITYDVSVVKSDRVNYTEEDIRRMAKRYGLTQREFLDCVQNEDGVWQVPDAGDGESGEADVFVDNEEG